MNSKTNPYKPCAWSRERHNRGLAPCTTRVRLEDLPDDTTTLSLDLNNLEPKDGAAYLEHLGVHGTEEDLLVASNEYGNHALALTLLGTYVKRHGGIFRSATNSESFRSTTNARAATPGP